MPGQEMNWDVFVRGSTSPQDDVTDVGGSGVEKTSLKFYRNVCSRTRNMEQRLLHLKQIWSRHCRESSAWQKDMSDKNLCSIVEKPRDLDWENSECTFNKRAFEQRFEG